MSPHKVYILPSPLALDSYGISKSGFLPASEPAPLLASAYYQPWEDVVSHLPQLVKDRAVREQIDSIPLLSTAKLDGEPEWRRAFLLLAVMAQGYIWAGDVPSERLPPAISIPFLKVASHLELQPVASYAALNLWNWKMLPEASDLTNPDNMRTLITFTGTEDESWFFVVSNAMEARAAPLLETMLNAVQAVEFEDSKSIIHSLKFLSQSLLEIGRLLERMDERCDPQIFYHKIRPMLAGSINDHLPRGVFYDEGDGRGCWRKYRGGSNGQSSLIQFFDAALGIDHEKTRSFHEEMREYMPGKHAAFLADFASISNIRKYVEMNESDASLTAAYNDAVLSLSTFRDKHIQLVTRYVIVPSRMAAISERPTEDTLAVHLMRPKTGSRPELVGTGGTTLVPFLRQSRNETKEATLRRKSTSACAQARHTLCQGGHA